MSDTEENVCMHCESELDEGNSDGFCDAECRRLYDLRPKVRELTEKIDNERLAIDDFVEAYRERLLRDRIRPLVQETVDLIGTGVVTGMGIASFQHPVMGSYIDARRRLIGPFEAFLDLLPHVVESGDIFPRRPVAREEVAVLLRMGTHRVTMFYGDTDFATGNNILMAILPKQRKGVQWHRDILPALNRYLKTLGLSVQKNIVGAEGMPDGLKMLESDKTPLVWVLFKRDNEDTGRGEFIEIATKPLKP